MDGQSTSCQQMQLRANMTQSWLQLRLRLGDMILMSSANCLRSWTECWQGQTELGVVVGHCCKPELASDDCDCEMDGLMLLVVLARVYLRLAC